MKKNSAQKGQINEPLSEINITPLGDLSLTLLIIIMIISPFIMQSMIKVYASKAVVSNNKQQQTKEKPLFINITTKDIYLNTKPINSDIDLLSKLANELDLKNDKTVLVTAEYNVSHGTVVHVIDIAKQSGAEKISLLKNTVASKDK